MRKGKNRVQKIDDILAALDDLRAKRHAVIDAEIAVEKLKVMIELESHNTPSQAAQQCSEFMTVKEVADFMRVSTNAVYEWIDKKDFPALSAGDDWRFDKQAVIEWMKRPRKKNQRRHLRVVNSR